MYLLLQMNLNFRYILLNFIYIKIYIYIFNLIYIYRMSGYKDADGNDLDTKFYINNSLNSISAEYKVGGVTSYGRYLERSSGNTANASEDTGYEINGVDLNRIYARKEDVRKVKFLLRGGDGTADGYPNAGVGADLAFSMDVQKGTTLTFGRVPGGISNSKQIGQHDWVGRGGGGGDAVYCSIGRYYKSDGTFNDFNNVVAIAGGGGGAGGYSTSANKTHFRGGYGGNGGNSNIAANISNSSSSGNYKYWSGQDGEIRDLGSGSVNQITLAKGGGDRSPIARAQYRSPASGAWAVHYGNTHTGTSKGTTSIAHALAGAYRGHGGSGGAGWFGGQAGVVGTYIYFALQSYETTALGGGGGSSAYRFQNFHDGILNISDVQCSTLINNVSFDSTYLIGNFTNSTDIKTKEILITDGAALQ